MYGRLPVFLVTMAIYTIFQIGDALATNMATLLVVRFIAGTFAAARESFNRKINFLPNGVDGRLSQPSRTPEELSPTFGILSDEDQP